MKRSFAVIGGDARQRCLLRQLRGLGFPASAYRVPDTEDSAPELSGCVRGADILILPMPALAGAEAVRAAGGGDHLSKEGKWLHFAMKVDDVEKAYETALKAGFQPKTAPKVVPLDAWPEKMTFNIAFVIGNDGEELEFFKQI